MSTHVEHSGRDETLATDLYTGAASIVRPVVQFVQFEYSIRAATSLLDDVAVALGTRLIQPLPDEHRALLEQDAEQAPEDMALALRMQNVQREALQR